MKVDIVDKVKLLRDRSGYVPEDPNDLDGKWYKQWSDAKFYIPDRIGNMTYEEVFKAIKKYGFVIEGEKEIRALLYPKAESTFSKCPKCGYQLEGEE